MTEPDQYEYTQTTVRLTMPDYTKRQYRAVISTEGSLHLYTSHELVEELAKLIREYNAVVARNRHTDPLPEGLVSMHVMTHLAADPEISLSGDYVYGSPNFQGRLGDLVDRVEQWLQPGRMCDLISYAYNLHQRPKPVQRTWPKSV